VLTVRVVVFWIVMPCRLVDRDQNFRQMFCFHIQAEEYEITSPKTVILIHTTMKTANFISKEIVVYRFCHIFSNCCREGGGCEGGAGILSTVCKPSGSLQGESEEATGKLSASGQQWFGK
jgi:hypothetical protein